MKSFVGKKPTQSLQNCRYPCLLTWKPFFSFKAWAQTWRVHGRKQFFFAFFGSWKHGVVLPGNTSQIWKTHPDATSLHFKRFGTYYFFKTSAPKHTINTRHFETQQHRFATFQTNQNTITSNFTKQCMRTHKGSHLRSNSGHSHFISL